MAGLAALAAVAVAVLAAVADADSYYATMENWLSTGGGMALVCRPLGGLFITDFSVAPQGRVPRGGRRMAKLLVEADRNALALCSWSYQGNYVANLRLLDMHWPEAKRCQDPGVGICRVVFEDDRVHVETPDGRWRVVGNLLVKRCRRHWLPFSTGARTPTTQIRTSAAASATPLNTSASD